MKKLPKRITLNRARDLALKAAQKMRRAQEASSGSGLCRCISCGQIHHWKAMDGGHYIPRTIRVTELISTNIWPQCKRCNGFLEGNTIAYEINLRQTIGDAEVDRLIALRMASSGSEDYYNRLSDDDKRSVVRRMTTAEYLEAKKTFETITKEIIRMKGLE